MLVTLSGIVTEVSLLHPKNALLAMLVTLLPIVTEVRPLHLGNAYLPTSEVPLGMFTCPWALGSISHFAKTMMSVVANTTNTPYILINTRLLPIRMMTSTLELHKNVECCGAKKGYIDVVQL